MEELARELEGYFCENESRSSWGNLRGNSWRNSYRNPQRNSVGGSGEFVVEFMSALREGIPSEDLGRLIELVRICWDLLH